RFGDGRARFLEKGAGRASLGVRRIGVGPCVEAADHRRACFGKQRRGCRMVEIKAILVTQNSGIPADCHMNGGPYIGPDAAAHPRSCGPPVFYASRNTPCLKSFSQVLRDASKDVSTPAAARARPSR